MSLPFSAAQLIVSKICHDLAGPIGAIAAGVEALSEVPGDQAALDLIDETAKNLSYRMGLFRVALGHGGQTLISDPDQLEQVLKGFLAAAGGRVTLNGSRDLASLESHGADAIRLGILLSLIGVDCLPRGGTIDIATSRLDDGMGLALTIAHEKAAIRDDIAAAWAVPIDRDDPALSARNIHVFAARVMADRIGAELELSHPEPGLVTIAAIYSN